jgi:hypothetical protein
MRLIRDLVLGIPFAVVASLALLATTIALVTTARVGPILSPLAQMAASGLGLAYFWMALQRHRRQRE